MEQNRDSYPTAPELFNQALDSFTRGEIAQAVARLRAGFFENLFMAAVLLKEEYAALTIWYPGAQAEPKAAIEYATRYRRLWDEAPHALDLLRSVWSDPLVRSELKAYVNLCKSLLNARPGRQQLDLLKERDRFLNPERIKRTQMEILQRIEKADYKTPSVRPHLPLVMLASSDPVASVQFYRSLFGVEPVQMSQIADGYAEFEFHGVHLAIHGSSALAGGDPYRLGPPPRSLGWGAIFVFQVAGFDRYYENAVRSGIEVVDSDLGARGRRSFVVKDPSGYLLEITEEEPRGIEPS
jgi:catechol 2,3-dioxygenase-like lactoylglutathione lyase family enzyme